MSAPPSHMLQQPTTQRQQQQQQQPSRHQPSACPQPLTPRSAFIDGFNGFGEDYESGFEDPNAGMGGDAIFGGEQTRGGRGVPVEAKPGPQAGA